MVRPNRAAVAGVLLAAACASTHPSDHVTDRPDAGEYRIGKEDVLEVVVWHEPDIFSPSKDGKKIDLKEGENTLPEVKIKK
jgi:protein involved in polysaccharide export with SLBB domain